jgi:hypothetical protein
MSIKPANKINTIHDTTMAINVGMASSDESGIDEPTVDN